MTDTDRLASIRARADAATPGPWEWTLDFNRHWALVLHDSGSEAEGRVAHCADDDDAEFIAAARQDIPFLLDQLAAAEAKIAQVQTLAEDFISAHDGDQGWDLKALNYLHREGQAILSASPVSALDAVRADAPRVTYDDVAGC